jgi:hypothetical protein
MVLWYNISMPNRERQIGFEQESTEPTPPENDFDDEPHAERRAQRKQYEANLKIQRTNDNLKSTAKADMAELKKKIDIESEEAAKQSAEFRKKLKRMSLEERIEYWKSQKKKPSR